MTDERFEHLYCIFIRVVAAPADRREALLRDLAAGDEALAQDVRSLIAIDTAFERAPQRDRLGKPT